MSSGGVFVAKALAAANGMNPDTDITIVVAGEGGASGGTAALATSRRA